MSRIVERNLTVRSLAVGEHAEQELPSRVSATEFNHLLASTSDKAFGPSDRNPILKALPWIVWTLVVGSLYVVSGWVLFQSGVATAMIALGANIVGSGLSMMHFGLLTEKVKKDAHETLNVVKRIAGDKGIAQCIEAWRKSPKHLPGALVMALVDSTLLAAFIIYPAVVTLGLADGTREIWIPIACAVLSLCFQVPFYVVLMSVVVGAGLVQSEAMSVSLDAVLADVKEKDFDIEEATKRYAALRTLAQIQSGMGGTNQLIVCVFYGVALVFTTVAFFTATPQYNIYLALAMVNNLWGLGTIFIPLFGVARRLELPREALTVLRGKETTTPGARRDELDALLTYIAHAPLVITWCGVEMSGGGIVKLVSLLSTVWIFVLESAMST